MTTSISFRFYSLLLLTVTFGIGTPQAAPAAPDDNEVVVHTDAGDVTVSDVRQNLSVLSADMQTDLLKNQAQLENVVRLLAAQKEILKEARDKTWDKRPEVSSALAVARKDVILPTSLAEKGKPPKDYPAEAEIEAAYKENLKIFTHPRKFHLAQIFIASAAADTDKDK